jgi:hypothetical protein
MSAQVTILQLPAAGAITGTEAVPIVQNGVTKQTTTGAIAGSPTQTYSYLTVSQTPQLANSRYVGVTNGLVITDAGAQGLFNISTTGALLSLVNSGTGFQVKTSSTVLTNRSIAVSGSGISITNGSGVSGDPTISLTGQVLNLANLSANGLMTITTGNAISATSILGTTSQIAVTNGNAVSGSPTIAIANDPILPGSGGLVVPVGTTGQRGSSTNGNFRYNTTTATFEGYANNAWGAITTGTGVTSIATGTGLTGGPITSTGTISIDVTGVSAATYGSSSVVPVIAVNAQGQITSATNTTINAVTLTTGTISTTPSNSTDIANKAYVDTVAQGLDTKASVVAGTTVNITLSGTQTIDGIVLVSGDRVLVKNQTAPADNGLYLCAAGAWTRTTDMDTWAEVPGAYVFVETGSTLADTGWVCTSDAGGTIGVTAITWAQFSGAGSGVSSITFGSTGLTPATATTGAVTVAGTLAVASGGTGQTTYTNGQLLIGNTTGNTLTKATLTAGSGITITNGTGTITIASSGGGTVTSVAQSFTGGIISVAGSPITTSGTLALTVAGTSGGVPYFTSTSTWATSALLAANALMVGGGAGVAPSTVTTGTGVVTALGVNTGTAGAFVVNGGALGTPSSGTLTNTTGLPISTGVSGLGTGVATALAIAIGSAGAPVVFNGALGTPSSGTVTNLTGTASININGTVGATTTNTGAFTTVAATTVTATTGIFGGTF